MMKYKTYKTVRFPTFIVAAGLCCYFGLVNFAVADTAKEKNAEGEITVDVVPAQVVALDGDDEKFRQIHWRNNEYVGGADNISGHFQYPEDITLDLEGHALVGQNDYEGFEGLRLSESEDIDKVAEIAGFIKKYGEAWALYAEHIGLDYATQESFEEAYQGEWDSEEDFAEDLASETMEIPKHLEFYIDYEKFARDLFINDFFSADGEGCKVYVFRRC